MPPESPYSEYEHAFGQLSESMELLSFGGSNDASSAIHSALTSPENFSQSHHDSAAMIVDDNGNSEGDGSGCADTDIYMSCYYFIRISTEALDEHDVQPCPQTKHDFQLVACKSSAGIETRLLYGSYMNLVDPVKDAAYILNYLEHYILEMQEIGKGLFLYVRVPDLDDDEMDAIGEHMFAICALLKEYRAAFHDVNIAFTSLD